VKPFGDGKYLAGGEVHRQLRKVSKTKEALTSATALLKLIYLAIKNIEKKWPMPPRNWGQTVLQLSVFSKSRPKLDLRV
jgi:putative transposase